MAACLRGYEINDLGPNDTGPDGSDIDENFRPVSARQSNQFRKSSVKFNPKRFIYDTRVHDLKFTGMGRDGRTWISKQA